MVSFPTVRNHYIASKAIYDERASIIAKIPGFWPAVFEEAPLEIEQHIQARDLPLLQHLTALEITRFEVDEDATNGDPRSVQFTFRFSENEYIQDETIVKKFWQRKGIDGWAGLVSEPVQIRWKEGKDLTDGMLERAVDGKGRLKTSGQDEDVELSFFTWFGYRGRDVSAEESEKASKHAQEQEKAGPVGGDAQNGDEEHGLNEKSVIGKALGASEEEEHTLTEEIFPAGEELATAISEDLFPGALKYYGMQSERPFASCVC